MRARQRGRLKQHYTLSLLSFVSKQMSTRLFSLLQYKGLLTKKHTHTQRHAHTSFWANQCTLVSVISQGALQCPPWVSEVTKAAREERSSYFLPSVFWPMYAFFLFFSFSLLISAHLYFSTMQLYCRERTMSVTSTQNAMFRHTDMYI